MLPVGIAKSWCGQVQCCLVINKLALICFTLCGRLVLFTVNQSISENDK